MIIPIAQWGLDFANLKSVVESFGGQGTYPFRIPTALLDLEETDEEKQEEQVITSVSIFVSSF